MVRHATWRAADAGISYAPGRAANKLRYEDGRQGDDGNHEDHEPGCCKAGRAPTVEVSRNAFHGSKEVNQRKCASTKTPP